MCSIDGKPLYYWRSGDEHACSDPTCANAHGIAWGIHHMLATRHTTVQTLTDPGSCLDCGERAPAWFLEV